MHSSETDARPAIPAIRWLAAGHCDQILIRIAYNLDAILSSIHIAASM
jgi:hypothetical protein